MASVQTLAVRLLGDLDVDGIDVQALGSKKARALLWLLALGRGGLVPTDALVDSLWTDAPPARPLDQLSVLISRLRAVLGRDRILHGDGGYRLVYDWLDVDEVEALTAETARRQGQGNPAGAAAAARVAMSLLRAAPSPPDLPGTWMGDRSAALDRLVARVRRTAAMALLAAGSWLEAVDVCADSLARDPYDEQALRVLMRANAAGGRTSAALAAYAAVQARLVKELGSDPSAETVALHAAILRGELAPKGGHRAVVAPTAPLVGRQLECARLDAAAERAGEATVQVVVVEGEAGIGKTSLVRTWVSTRPAGDVVLFGVCGELGRTAPLDPVLVPLAAHLRGLGRERSGDILAAEAPLLAPLLGLSAAATMPTLLADGIVGPTLLYAALATVVERLAETGLVVLVLDQATAAGRRWRSGWSSSADAGYRSWSSPPCGHRSRPRRPGPTCCGWGRWTAGRPDNWWVSSERSCCSNAPVDIRCSWPSWPSARTWTVCRPRWWRRSRCAVTRWVGPGRPCAARPWWASGSTRTCSPRS